MKKRQNQVVFVVLCLIILVSLASVLNTVIPKRAPRTLFDWTCDSCGHVFRAKFQPGPIMCRKCNKIEAVRTFLLKCENCDKIFEAYRLKPDPNMAPRSLMKAPGGEWVEELDVNGQISPDAIHLKSKLHCPNCGNQGKLKPYTFPNQLPESIRP